MTAPTFSVSRPVLDELIRLAALEVSGVVRVGRVGTLRRAPFSGPAVVSRVEDGRADVWISIVARPGHALVPLTRQVRATVTAAVERLVGLQVGEVDVFVDGVGA
jgi:uncharacterized alkaline shock family protein YloU